MDWQNRWDVSLVRAKSKLKFDRIPGIPFLDAAWGLETISDPGWRSGTPVVKRRRYVMSSFPRTCSRLAMLNPGASDSPSEDAGV
jgi:hypothetical protein